MSPEQTDVDHYKIGKLYRVNYDPEIPGNSYVKRFCELDIVQAAQWKPGGKLDDFSRLIKSYSSIMADHGTIAMVVDIFLVDFYRGTMPFKSEIIEMPLFLMGNRQVIPSYNVAYHGRMLVPVGDHGD